MSRPPGVDRGLVRERIVEYLGRHAGHATMPEIRQHLIAELRIGERLAIRATAEVVHGPGFRLENAHRGGPRTIRVRLAPPRRHLDP